MAFYRDVHLKKNNPVHTSSDFLQKYNQPVPRYTSYPTVPFWRDRLDVPQWKEAFREPFAECNVGDCVMSGAGAMRRSGAGSLL